MSEQYKILVVDDDPSIVNIIETALGEAGYAVITASNGEQAVQSRPRQKEATEFWDWRQVRTII